MMRDTPTPLAERMVPFWHNHFATSAQKVPPPQPEIKEAARAFAVRPHGAFRHCKCARRHAAVSLTNTEAFVNKAKLVTPAGVRGNAALEHVLRVEAGVLQAAEGLRNPGGALLATEFPTHGFDSIRPCAPPARSWRGRRGAAGCGCFISRTAASTPTAGNSQPMPRF